MRAVMVATTPFHLEMAASLQSRAPWLHIAVAATNQMAPGSASTLPVHTFALSGAGRLTGARRRTGAAAAALGELSPDVLVIGNDMAPVERAMTRAARARGLPVVLLQDGLFPAWRPNSWRERLGRTVVRAGLPDLAPTVYGIGEATHAGLLGPAWTGPFLRDRERDSIVARPVGNVVFTNTVKNVGLHDARAWRATVGLHEAPTVIFFTTDLLRGLGASSRSRHLRQATVIGDVLASWGRAGWTVRVRLHPAENLGDYSGLVPTDAILDMEIPLAAAIGAADVGLVSGSAVSLILAASGRPVGWPVLDGAATMGERAAARWLGVPLVPSRPAPVIPEPERSRLAELLVDDADDPRGSRSGRLVEEAMRLQ